MIALMLAAAALGWFPPFPVGPAATAPDAVHITEWAPTAAEAAAACRVELSYYPPGTADCEAQPVTMAPNPADPGWAGPPR
ncbi:MAG TPA: hypothetical protein VFY38_14625 [Pseudonocardia sp.]|nr:hypothetical protein [Pseudonocardia sp.]